MLLKQQQQQSILCPHARDTFALPQPALHFACTAGATDCAARLLELGAQPGTANKLNLTPLMCATCCLDSVAATVNVKVIWYLVRCFRRVLV